MTGHNWLLTKYVCYSLMEEVRLAETPGVEGQSVFEYLCDLPGRVDATWVLMHNIDPGKSGAT